MALVDRSREGSIPTRRASLKGSKRYPPALDQSAEDASEKRSQILEACATGARIQDELKRRLQESTLGIRSVELERGLQQEVSETATEGLVGFSLER